MRRAIHISLWLLLLLLVLPIVLVGWLIGTESGLNSGWRMSRAFIPDNLRIERVSGVLLRSVTVEGLHYSDEYQTVDIESAGFSWTPSALFDGLLRIGQVRAEGVDIRTLKVAEVVQDETDRPPQPLRIPSGPRFVIDDVLVTNFSYHAPPPRPASPASPASSASSGKSATNAGSEIPTPPPTTFERLTFGLRHEAGRVEVLDFEFVAPPIGRVDMTATLRYGRSRVAVEQLVATLAASNTELRLVGDVDLSDIDPVYDAQLDWQRLRWPLTGDPDVESRQGRLKASGTGANLNADLSAALGAGQLEAKGRVQRAEGSDQPRFVFDVDGRQLQWPLRGDAPQVRVGRINAKIDGSADDYRLTLDADVAPKDAPAGRIRTSGRGDSQQFVMREFHADVLEGVISGTGSLRWAPALAAQLALDLAGVNPDAFDANWPGKLDGNVRLRIDSPGGVPVIDIEAAKLSGTLRDRAMRVDLRGRFSKPRSEINQAKVVMGPSVLEVTGSVTQTLALDWTLNSSDLDSLWPGLRGALSADGRLTGPRDGLRVRAKASGTEVGFGDLRMQSLTMNADIDAADNQRSHFELVANDGQKGLTRIDNVQFSASGRHADHNVSWLAMTSDGSVKGKLQGNLMLARPSSKAASSALHPPEWNVQLLESDVTPVTLGGWKLRQPVKGKWTPSTFSLGRACWASDASSLCMNADKSPRGLVADLDVDTLPYGYFSYFLPAGVKLSGTLNAGLALRGNQRELHKVELHIDGSAGQLSHKQSRREDITFDFSESRVRGELREGRWSADANLGLPDGGGISLRGGIAPGSAPTNRRPLSATMTADVRDLSFVAMFLRELVSVSGAMTGTMQIGGNLEKPKFDGELRVDDGVVALASPGIDVENVDLTITGDGNGVVALNLTANSGEGNIELLGNANLISNPFRADATLTGRDFQIANLREASVWASPNVALTMVDRRLDLTGEVVIPRAEITPRKFAAGGGVTPSRDQVIIVPGAEEAEPVDVYSQVRVTFGDAVHFEGFGLDARIAGSIEAVDRPGQLTAATGELRLEDGFYKAYGQDLDIRRGKLLFKGGPAGEPGLDILAVRKPDPDIEVGVLVRGRLEKPEFRLYSSPSMSESDQLSWLVLGRPAESGGSNSENAALANAALALGLKGGKLLAGNLPDKLGIDKIEVGSVGGAPDQAALVIGKYLSPKLYVSYGIGLFEPSSTFRLRYELSRAFTLLTESGLYSSGDLVYTFEN